MKDEGNAVWTLERAKNAYERQLEVQPVQS